MADLEKLEKKLYGKEPPEEIGRPLKAEPPESAEIEVKKYWEEEKHQPTRGIILEEKLKPVGEKLGILSRFFSKRAVYVLAGVFALIIAASGFLIYQYLFTAREIALSVEAPPEVLIGAPFEAKINFRNNSGNILKNAKLSLALPSSAAFAGKPPLQTVESRSLGDIGVGTASGETFGVIVLGDPRSVKRFSAVLSYEPVLGTRFERRLEFELAVAESAVALDFVVPEKVLSGEEFGIEVSYKNVSGIDFSSLDLVLTYPPSFSFIKAAPAPSESNGIWRLGSLKAGSEGRLQVKGFISGPEQSFFNFEARLSASFLGQSYLVDKKSAGLAIASSPLALSVFLNDATDYAARPGETLRYTVVYRNNTNVGLKDAVIKARLSGEMFNFSSLDPELFFDSLTQTLTWNAANVRELQLVSPGAGGAVNFEVALKDSYPIRRLSDKNFVLRVEAVIDSPTVPYFVAAEKVRSETKLETKVRGAAAIDALGYFRDAKAGILNAGPFPPKVNVPTNYTVHWRLTNFSTDVRNVEVRAFLQSGVRFTGKTKSNVSSEPIYNERSQEMIWVIDRIMATRGVVGEPVEAVFQVEATPAVNQVGAYQPLIGETAVRAIDEFTGLELFAGDAAISTALPDDPTVPAGSGKVGN